MLSAYPAARSFTLLRSPENTFDSTRSPTAM